MDAFHIFASPGPMYSIGNAKAAGNNASRLMIKCGLVLYVSLGVSVTAQRKSVHPSGSLCKRRLPRARCVHPRAEG